MAKCKYYRESTDETYSRECDGDSIHPSDAEDYKYCPNCGKKVKLKEYTAPPWKEDS